MKVSIIRRFWVMLTSWVIAFYACRVNCFEVRGAENIPSAGGVLLLANHISGFDTVFIPAVVLTRQPWQMLWAPAKEELFQNPLLGALFRSWGAFPVKRGRDVRAGKELGRLLQSEKVMLFPEGTRHKDGQLGKGNRGVGKLIYDHRPVVIATSLSGINRWQVFQGGQTGSICFSRPLDFSDLFEREDNKETHNLIVERAMAAIGAGLSNP